MREQRSAHGALELIDSRPFSAYQRIILALCGSVIFLDGLDTQSISVATKSMSVALNIPLSDFGLIFSALQLGGLIGTVLFGYLADRLGRRPLVVISAFLIAGLTLGTAAVDTYAGLLFVRFIGGIGLGGIFPCVLALGSEYVSRKHRGLAVGLLYANYSLGAAIGALVNGYVLTTLGWRAVFALGGALSIATALAMLVWLPESLSYLILRGRTDKLRAVFGRLYPKDSFDPDELPTERVATTTRPQQVPVRAIFGEGRSAVTLVLLGVLLFSYATIKVMTVWLTPLLQAKGVPVMQTSAILSGLDIGSMLGLGVAGYVIGKFGPTRSLLPALLLLGATVILMSYQVANFSVLLPSGFVIGFTGGIGQSAPLALFAQVYPTRMRSTALGLGGTAGQIGKIASPMLVGTVLAYGCQPDSILLGMALLPALGALLILGLAFRPGPIAAEESLSVEAIR